MNGTDDVLVRRASIARWVALGKRVGYGLFGLAIVAFFVGLGAGYTGALTTGIILALVVGSLILAPAIVFGYGVRAAEREERRAGRHG